MKRKIEDMETIVWQTPANPPERHDYIFRDRNFLLHISLPALLIYPFIICVSFFQAFAMSSHTTLSSSPMYARSLAPSLSHMFMYKFYIYMYACTLYVPTDIASKGLLSKTLDIPMSVTEFLCAGEEPVGREDDCGSFF